MQSLLRLAASCNFPVPFSRCCLPYCCFLPSKAERHTRCTTLLRNKISSTTSMHHIQRHVGLVRHTHNWVAYLAALPIPSQLLPSRAKRYGLTPFHSIPTNPLSPLRAARQVFSNKLHKTTPCNAGSYHLFLENCYV